MSSKSNANRKPSGGRPLVRRLFSKDSVSSLKEAVVEHPNVTHLRDSVVQEDQASGDVTHSLALPASLPLLQTEGNDEKYKPWMENEMVRSPSPTGDSLTSSPSTSTPGSETEKSTSQKPSSQPIYATRFTKPSLDLHSVDERLKNSSQPPPSPSKLRWEHLRQHILPNGPTLPPSSVHSPSPSFTSFAQIGVPRAPAPLPKPSRLARLGFRQVVDHVREVAEDTSRKFSDEIQRACWIARFGDARPYRPEREPTQGTMGAGLYLPFMSSTSLPHTASASTSSLPFANQAKHALRRPQSTQTLALTSRSPTFAALHTLISRYAAIGQSDQVTHHTLPREEEVLSVLLTAFLSQNIGQSADERRWLALEIFDVVIRTWKAESTEAGLERCLWCCKAATAIAPSPLRSRILFILGTLLSSPVPVITTPLALETIISALILLLPRLTDSTAAAADDTTVRTMVEQIMDGKYGHLDFSDLQQKYGAAPHQSDLVVDLQPSIGVEAIVRCLEFGSSFARRWILNHVIESYWPLLPVGASFTQLQAKIHANKIKVFLRSALQLLHRSLRMPSEQMANASVIYQILSRHVFPELDAIPDADAIENKCLAVRLALELICTDITDKSKLVDLVSRWSREPSDWQNRFRQEMNNFIETGEWIDVVRLVTRLFSVLPEDTRVAIAGFLIPQLQERLSADPPPYPCQPLTSLLEGLAQAHPHIFYKPLFVCAASSKEVIVMHQLTILIVLARFIPDFWTRDAEMMAIALMSDASKSIGKGKEKEVTSPGWGKARLGQSIILLEVICRLRALRSTKKESAVPDQSHATLIRFAIGLETRIGILLEAKEQMTLLPLSQRLLLTILFLEIRLCSRSLKPAPWLQHVVSWALHFRYGSILTSQARMTSEVIEEVSETLDKIRAMYIACKEDSRSNNQRRTTVFFPPKPDSKFSNSTANELKDVTGALYQPQETLLASLPENPISTMLELLVCVSGLLSREEYVRLGPLLWEHCLDIDDSRVSLPTCFLIMQCAEKVPADFLQFLDCDMSNPTASVRRKAVVRLSVLSSWRFQLLSQAFITDRNHRRPFKLARPPMAFVPTDVGSSLYVHEENLEDSEDVHSQALPLDLRRRLSEMGWNDDSKPVDQQLEWARTPMSLLPSNRLDHLVRSETAMPHSPDVSPSPSPSPSPTPSPSKSPVPKDGQLLRRNSSTGGQYHGVKRRPIFVQSLVTVFFGLASLAMDSDFTVASMARDSLMDFMRDDPATLCRPIMDILSGNVEEINKAMTTLRVFLHIQRTLPPGLSHYAFNHLVGFLKYSARETESPNALHNYAYTVPILAKLVNQVSDMSVRELRRAKVESFVFPSGLLWFPETAPAGPMFPKGPGTVTNPFEDTSMRLVWITMIRTSQNMLFLAMLKRNAQDVHVIRKSLSRLVLPSQQREPDGTSVEPADLVPRASVSLIQGQEPGSTLDRLSLTLSRSHLLLVAQVFRSMTRHLNDRNELANLLDGVNRILLRHGDDIGIVGHALIVYMIASTRFRRLMASGTCFSLFMPVIAKIYCESESHDGIRAAVEYAVNRFYAVHEEAFVFQTLDVLSSLVRHPGVDGEWVAKHIYNLLSSLKTSQTHALDMAGIHETNKVQEKQTAMAITAEEKPQAFLASLRKDGRQASDKVQPSFPVETFDGKRFQLDNLVRMLLTVIAHGPTAQRAEYFMRFFRYFTPHLYNASQSVRSLLREGLDALGVILLTKVSGKSKTADSAQSRTTLEDVNLGSFSMEANFIGQTPGKPNAPSDVLAMRQDYLQSVAAFASAGGQLSNSSVQRVLDLSTAILRDASESTIQAVESFFNRIVGTIALRDNPKFAMTLLRGLTPIISVFGASVDFTGVFQTLAELSANPVYANDPSFSQLVVVEVCRAGLDICELAASENVLFSLPFRPAVVSLLGHSVCLLGSDCLAEIERRAPSQSFLAGVVIPFTLTLRTTAELASENKWTDSWRRDAHGRAWVRLLSYAMTACQRPPSDQEDRRSSLQSLDRSRFDEQSSSTAPRNAPTSLVFAMQLIKIIVLRAEGDLSALVPGIWSRIGSFLRSILSDGDASFAIKHDLSPAATPVGSLHIESNPSSPFENHRRSNSSDIPFPPAKPRNQQAPRVVDYLVWSMLEFLCLHRSPLLPQMRMFMHEKVVAADEQLHVPQGSYTHRHRDRRLSSSVFAKPRVRTSATPTPEGSPRLGPTESIPLHLNLPTLSARDAYDERLSGYNRFPPSPISKQEGTQKAKQGKRIVHLGPDYRPARARGQVSSQDYGSLLRSSAKSTVVCSPALIKRTHERINVTLACMGYGGLQEDADFDIRAWTKPQALECLVVETQDLMKEFSDDFAAIDQDFPLSETSL